MTTQIEKIMHDDYETGLGINDPITIIWAAYKTKELFGSVIMEKELKKINRIRRRHGKIPAYIN